MRLFAIIAMLSLGGALPAHAQATVLPNKRCLTVATGCCEKTRTGAGCATQDSAGTFGTRSNTSHFALAKRNGLYRSAGKSERSGNRLATTIGVNNPTPTDISMKDTCSLLTCTMANAFARLSN